MRQPVGVFAAAFGLFLLLGISSVAVTAGLVEPAEAAGLPQLKLNTSVLSPGEKVTITGTGWPAHKLLQAAMCGGGPLAVSSECDLIGPAIQFGSADNGVVAASLTVTVPPVPCPCVILVTQVNPSAAESLPVTIEGAPTGSFPTSPFPARPTVRVSDVQVVSQSSWTSWFGAAAPRELIVTVHNRGSAAVRPLLVAEWIDGSDHYVITSPIPKALRAGGTAQAQGALLSLDVRPRPISR